MRGRLVEEEQRRLGRDRAGESDAPDLSGRKPAAVLADLPVEEGGRAGEPGRPVDVGIRPTERNRVPDRPWREAGPLREPGDEPSPIARLEGEQVDAADRDRALVGVRK